MLSGDLKLPWKLILHEYAILFGMAKQPLNDDQRQAFLDNLSEDQVNENAEQKLDKAIARAAQQSRSKPETLEPADGYSDTQTHSDTTADTSDWRSDTSRPWNVWVVTKSPQ